MITVRRFCGTWLNGGRNEAITYDLQKSEVAGRITQAMADGREEFVIADLARLDAGSLAEDKLLALYTRDEIRRALAEQRELLTEAMKRLDRMEKFVGQGGHEHAQGGDAVARAAQRR